MTKKVHKKAKYYINRQNNVEGKRTANRYILSREANNSEKLASVQLTVNYFYR